MSTFVTCWTIGTTKCSPGSSVTVWTWPKLVTTPTLPAGTSTNGPARPDDEQGADDAHERGPADATLAASGSRCGTGQRGRPRSTPLRWPSRSRADDDEDDRTTDDPPDSRWRARSDRLLLDCRPRDQASSSAVPTGVPPPAPGAAGGRHRVALERRRQPGPEQARPGHRARRRSDAGSRRTPRRASAPRRPSSSADPEHRHLRRGSAKFDGPPRAGGRACPGPRAARAPAQPARSVGEVRRVDEGPLAGDGPKARVADLDVTVPALRPAARKPRCDAVGHGEQRPLDHVRVGRVDIERVLVADDFAASRSPTGSGSTPARSGGSDGRRACRTAAPAGPVRQRGQVADRGHPELAQCGAILVAHAPQPARSAAAPGTRPRGPAARRPGRRACAGPTRPSPRAWSSPPPRTRSARLLADDAP